MRDLYDQLILEGEAGIQRLIDERTQEGLQLDFKQKGRPANGAFEDNDKKILAKAVSGFANSAGGLIVWGVNAEKVDDVDCAQPPAAPIAQIEQFSSEAASLVGQLIQPRHDGVHITPIRSAAGDGSGFLLMYVERSERRPHRSEAKAQKQYYKRAGDSFFEMEHYDIEDAFNRISAPDLEVYLSDHGWATYGAERQQKLVISLKNNSSSLARYPFIAIDGAKNVNIDNSAIPTAGLIKTYSGHQQIYYGGADHVIHPGMNIMMAELVLGAQIKDGVWMIKGVPAHECEISFGYTYGCADARTKSGRMRVPAMAFLPSDISGPPA